MLNIKNIDIKYYSYASKKNDILKIFYKKFFSKFSIEIFSILLRMININDILIKILLIRLNDKHRDASFF